MKKIYICCVIICMVGVLFCACGKKENNEITSTTESVEITEAVSYTYNGTLSDEIIYSPDDTLTYRDMDYTSQKQNGNTTEYYENSKLVMVKTFENNLLTEKVVYYDDCKYTLTYTYTDGKLTMFVCVDENNKSEEKGQYFTDGKINAYSKYVLKDDSVDFFAYEFDENGNVINGFDNFEEVSEKIDEALFNNIISALRGDLT